MKSIILKGQEIKIGSKVRFVNNSDLYTFDKIGEISKPRLGRVYTVRGFTDKDGFFLEQQCKKLALVRYFENLPNQI